MAKIKREAHFGLLFRHWIKANPWHNAAAFELKQTTTDSLPFSDVQPHQVAALLAAKHAQILYKAPDDSRMVKPFDYFYLTESDAYVVIRYPKTFCLIDIDAWITEDHTSRRRSLTSLRAREIAIITINLKNNHEN